MKHIRFNLFIFLLINLLFVISCKKENLISEQRKMEVVVYTYDSFLAEWGPGPKIARDFFEKEGYTVTYVNCGDAAQILSRAILEKDNPQADILLGIDNNLISKAKDENVLEKFKPKNADKFILQKLSDSLSEEYFLTPYDYSKFSIIYDTKSKITVPTKLEDLTNPEYAKKLILMDPRTSTPGLGFVAWTIAVYGEEYENYWRRLKPSILTMASNWSSGYGLFTKGEAPLVISYETSPAYHVYDEKSTRYKALSFTPGHIQQIEGAGVVKNATNETGAKAFIEYLITEQAQNEIPLTQWMYPVNKNVELPECYKTASPQYTQTLVYDEKDVFKAVPKIIKILSE